MNVPPLTFRLEKGSPLDSEENDQNLKLLRDFCDGLGRLFELVFNANGTLKTNSVSTDAIQDRAVTQRKLDWLANFFCVASGVDNYTATIDPTTGFTVASYGDGANTAFILPILFTNANTGASDLAINGAAAKPIKKLTGQTLVAGDILAGSVHILVYDGTNFQMVSPSPVVDASQVVGAHGVPNFITPVQIATGTGGVAPTAYSALVADGVPATASAVILEAKWLIKNDSGAASIIIRKESGGDDYLLGYGIGDGAHTQVEAGTNQGIFPVKNTAGVLSLEYEVTLGFDNGWTINLVGYIS